MIQSEIPFDHQETFFANVDEIFVAPCIEHQLFKDVVASRHTNPPFDLPCECSKLSNGWCENCKTSCYLINSNSVKVKMTEKTKNNGLISFKYYYKKKLKACHFLVFVNFVKRLNVL